MVKSRTILVFGVLLSVCPTGFTMAQSPPAAAQVPSHKLTDQEVRSAFVGNTSYTAGQFGPKTGVAYYLPDGVRVVVRFLHSFKDTDTYTVAANGTFCSKYTHLRKGAEVCQSVYQIGPNVYHWVKPDGSTYDETVVPGNPEGL